MYFSNNSRCVLRKAQLLSPNCLSNLGKNLSFKKPKDDPTKPSLRINIPNDDNDDLLMKKKVPGTSVSANYNDVFRKSDEVLIPEVDNLLEESPKELPKHFDLLTSDRAGYSYKTLNSEKLSDFKANSDGVSFDNVNNDNITFPSGKNAGKREEKEAFDKNPQREKTLYILVDFHSKNEPEIPEKTTFTDGKQDTDSLRQTQSKQSSPKSSKMEKAQKLLHQSKHLSKFPLSKLGRKPRRFEVHELEDEATYILYVKLKKQLQKKPCDVGCVPEKEFTIRTGSNLEHSEIYENNYELKKPTDFYKFRRRQKTRKNEEIILSQIANDKTIQEPKVKSETKLDKEYSTEDAEKQGKNLFTEFGVFTSEGVKNFEKFMKAEGSPNPEIAAEDQGVYTNYASAGQIIEKPKAEDSIDVPDFEGHTPPLPVKNAPPITENRDVAIEKKTLTTKNSEVSSASSDKVEATQENVIVQYDNIPPVMNQNKIRQFAVAENVQAIVNEAKPDETPENAIEYAESQTTPSAVHESQATTPMSAEQQKNQDDEEKKYLSIHNKSDDKSDNTYNENNPPNCPKAAQQEKSPVENSKNDVSDFETCSSFVSIGRAETSTYPMTFGMAFPPLLKEALNTHLRPERNFNEKWKNLSNDENYKSESRMQKLSENSVLFPDKKSEGFDYESLFETREQIIRKIINNEEESPAKCCEVTKKTDSSVDGLLVMKKVKEMVQLDLDNVVKIFDDGGSGQVKELSSVVVSTRNGWEVNRQELDVQIAMRQNEMKLDLLRSGISGVEYNSHSIKYLPSRKRSETVIQLPDDQRNSVIMLNPKSNEFFICKEALAEAINRKTKEPLNEINETLDFLAKRCVNAKDAKSGDSILVFDDETQSWRVDFSILEKRQQQLQLEEELAKRSELILETFEELEKRQINTVPKPDSKEKKTFDYVNKEWKDIKNPNEKSTKSKYPFKDVNAEEIRKKNSDLYDNLFMVKKKETRVDESEKKAPGISSSKKESKSADSGEKKEASAEEPPKADLTSKKPEEPESNSKLPQAGKINKKEDDNFWETFLKMNILPKDISEIPKIPPQPIKEPEKSIPAKKIEVPSLKIKIPFQRQNSDIKKETEGETRQEITKKIPPPPPPRSEKIEKPAIKAPPPSSQISKEDPKKTDLPKKPPKVDPPKSEISKLPPILDPLKAPPKSGPPKTDSSKAPPKSDPPKATPKSEPSKTDSSKAPPKSDPPKAPPKSDPPKASPKSEPSKTDSSKAPPKSDPPKASPKSDSSKLDPPKSHAKTFPSKTSKITDPKTPTGGKSASFQPHHYVSDKIIEISRAKGKEASKTKTKIETVKLNITPDTRLPSKITEINLNKKFEMGKPPKEVEKKSIDHKNPPDDSIKKSEQFPKEKKSLNNNFEKYRTPFSDPEYEEKSMQIKSDIASNPNLKKLDNWNKTLVLHDIMKPPENIETWLKDETDKMATLLLKILQETSDGKPKKKHLPIKAKPENQGKGNPYENIRKKQENTPESFLFRVRTVNFSLENESKKSLEDAKPIKSKKENETSMQSVKTAKPSKIVEEVKIPMQKNTIPAATIPPSVKTHQFPGSMEERRGRTFPWAGDGVEDFVPTPKEPPRYAKIIVDVTEEIPGPEILKKISNTWKLIPVLDSQVTVFTLFKLFQLVNLGRSFLNSSNSGQVRRNTFGKFFAKYGPIVNVKGPLSGNVILIHKPEHLAAVFEQDAAVFVRSVFDSVEQVRKETDEKSQSCEVPIDWNSPVWTELKKATNDSAMKGCERYLASIEIAVDSLIGIIKKNKNSQDLVSEDFMQEIKRWSLEGLCSVLFEKSFGFMEGRTPNTNWVIEPDKLFAAVEKASIYLNKCESGFQMWRLMPTPSAANFSQGYHLISIILMKQILQAGINLRNKNELLKDGNKFRIKDLTLVESMLLNDGLTNEEINCNLIDILLIGTNTINSTVGFLLYNLALNIRVQNNLFHELKEAMPSKYSQLDYNKLNSLKYLQACVKENFRLNTPIPVFYRLLQNDILLSNYFIPKGTYVVMDQRVSSQKEYVFEDPQKFSPERWLNEEKWMLEHESFAAFPLCHGPRAEFAKKVVELQLYAFVAKIIRNFHVEYHYGEIQGTNNLINLPDNPLKLNFIERES